MQATPTRPARPTRLPPALGRADYLAVLTDDVYPARPVLTRGRPAAPRCWDHLGEGSPQFHAVQRRLAIFWGTGLLGEAGVRIAIVAHSAAGLVSVVAGAIIVALCLLSGPPGGVRLHRLLAAELAAYVRHTIAECR